MNRKHKRQNTQGTEAGFTLIELIIVLTIASILGTFVFSIITKSLAAQINMQKRKERSDDAVLSMERMNRELRETKDIVFAGNNMLLFEKNISSSTDTNRFILYVRDIPTDRVMRQSAATVGGFPGNSTSGSVIATDVWYFYSVDVSNSRVFLELKFTDGSNWQTRVFPRNYGL